MSAEPPITLIEWEESTNMTIVRQLPRDMSALCGKADDDGPPQLLSGWCCGATDEAEEIDEAQSESDSKSDINTLKSESTKSATIVKSTNAAKYPPIVFSPVDESKLTLANQRSIAGRSITESTFVDDNDDDLYMVLAGIIGDFGDEIVVGIGYNKDDKTSASVATDQTSSTDSSPEASATKRASKDNDADDNTSLGSSTRNPFPTWVAFSLETEEMKQAKNENIEIKPKKNRTKLTNFLFRRNKKSAFVASPSDTSTATSAMSSLGLCTAWAGN